MARTKTKIKKMAKEEKPKAKVLINEISFDDSPYYKGYQYRPYNPTYLYQKKGSLDIYDTMRRDEQIKAVLTFKKYAAINSGWEIQPAKSKEGKDDKKDIEIAEFVERNLKEDIQGSFNDKIMEILTALDYGYSVTEKVYELESVNYYLRNLKTRAPHSFEFHTDDFGNLPKDGLQQLTGGGNKSLPQNKFIIFTHQKEFGNWYGISDLQSCYRAWWSKDIIIKFMNMYLERFGTPLTWGKYPPASRPEQINQLKDVLNKIQQRSSITTPDNMTIELLEATRRGTADYKGAIDLYNMMIARSMLMPDLLGLSKGIEGGSFALGKAHFNMFLMVLQKVRGDLEETVKDQLIKQLVDLNFNTDKYPIFKFKPMSEEDKKELAKIWIEAVKTGAIAPTFEESNYLREITNFPLAEEPPEEEKPPKKPLPDDEDEDEDEVKAKFALEQLQFSGRVNFRRIDRKMKETEIDLEQELSKIVGWTFDDMIDQIIKKKIVENKDYEKLETVQPKYMGEFRVALKDSLSGIYREGRNEAIEEIKKVRSFAKAPESMSGTEAKKLIDAKTFAITGDLKAKVKKDINWIVLKGIEAGDSTKVITANINKLKIDKYIPDRTRAGAKINKAAYIEMVSRTAITDAFNQGRNKYFESPNVKPNMRAYEYSAILDATTSPICEKLHGEIYAVDDAIWGQITPPNHPNCRSVLIPVTKFDEFKMTESYPALISTGNPGSKFWTIK